MVIVSVWLQDELVETT